MHPLIALCLPRSTGPAAMLSVCSALPCNFCTGWIAFWQLLSHIFLSAPRLRSAKQDFFFPFSVGTEWCCVSSPEDWGEKVTR